MSVTSQSPAMKSSRGFTPFEYDANNEIIIVNPGRGDCGDHTWIRLFTVINDLEKMGSWPVTIFNQFQMSKDYLTKQEF